MDKPIDKHGHIPLWCETLLEERGDIQVWIGAKHSVEESPNPPEGRTGLIEVGKYPIGWVCKFKGELYGAYINIDEDSPKSTKGPIGVLLQNAEKSMKAIKAKQSIKKTLLLTGASGFIGSHFLEHVLTKTDWEVICLCSWKHKGTPERIEEVLTGNSTWRDRVTVITHDLETPLTQRTMDRIGIVDYIVNFAAESHVDRSIETPVSFIQNNVNLMLSMLEFARTQKSLQMFVQVSTDEVYGVAPEGINHKEWAPILPSNPYSASKAAQEAIAIAYWRTYKIPLVITNTMNNFGEMQDPEKYVAQLIRKIHNGKTVSVHGTEKSIGSRYYLHARNHADAVLFLLRTLTKYMCIYEGGDGDYRERDKEVQTLRSRFPQRFNVVGDVELNNLEMAQLVAELMGKPLSYEFTDFHATRPGHDKRYALDGTKLQSFGWKPPLEFKESLKKYIDWTLKHPTWL